MIFRNKKSFFLIPLLCFTSILLNAETLPLFDPQNPPLDYSSMWQGFNPRTEPIESEVLKEWEQDGVVLRIVRFRIGIFKGSKSIMAGVYGYPKGKNNLPALLQIHGGGQYADYRAVLSNAKRGYATLSMAWAGRIFAPEYTVSPDEVKLFWEGKHDDPKCKATTDWGSMDAYHAPSRFGQDAFASIPVTSWTLDPVRSPRNNSWFLITLAGRRGLTFLEQQPEVDASKLGVYGHSMGGKLTVMITGSDHRVKAAVPSCGGISDRYSEDDLHFETVSDPPSLQRINVPILFLSPSNDFHGRINDMEKAVNEIQSKEWRVSCSPHHNHQDTPEYEVATQVWFDQHLKGEGRVPKMPNTEIIIDKNNFPKLLIQPDKTRKVAAIEVYFTQQGHLQERGKSKDNFNNTKHRFWKYARPLKSQKDNQWIAELPIFSIDRSLWVFANIRYTLETPISASGYYYGAYHADSFILSSLLHKVSVAELKKYGSICSVEKNLLIEDFSVDWKKNWFAYNHNKWGLRTNKLHEPNWSAPSPQSRLSIEVRSDSSNKMVIWVDGYGVEFQVLGSSTWQRFSFLASDFLDSHGNALAGWSDIRELRLDDTEKLLVLRGSSVKPVQLGEPWVGKPPEFRSLRWIE